MRCRLKMTYEVRQYKKGEKFENFDGVMHFITENDNLCIVDFKHNTKHHAYDGDYIVMSDDGYFETYEPEDFEKFYEIIKEDAT